MVDSAPVIFDTGSSLINIPSETLSKIMPELLSGISYTTSGGLYYGPCDSSLYSTISFVVGTYWIDISPDFYVLQTGSSTCTLALSSLVEKWIFGDTFF